MIHKYNGTDIGLSLPKYAPSFFPKLIESGEWEKEEYEMINEAIKGHRVLEGGSCLGLTTIALARNADFVISLEANPELADFASRNQQLNGSTAKIVVGALSVSDGEVEFTVTPDLWTSKIGNPSKRDKKIKAKQYSAEKLIKKYNINALVLDVEGEEEKIIDQTDLSPIEVLIVELHEQVNKDAVIESIKAAGFEIKNTRADVNNQDYPTMVLAIRRRNLFKAFIKRVRDIRGRQGRS